MFDKFISMCSKSMYGSRSKSHKESQLPLSYVMPLTASVHPDSVAKRRALIVPYKSTTAPAPPALLTPQPNNAQTLIDVVAAIATKEDSREG